MTTFQFSQVDVFGSGPLTGNPLAVVHNAEELTEDQMRAFARWTGLSETTFLLPPTEEGKAGGADYRVRIFTPSQEYPFAGHPTLGSAHAWLASQDLTDSPSTLVQECGVGLVPVSIDAEVYSFKAPGFSRFEPIEDQLVDQVTAGLGITRDQIVDSHWISNGPAWMGFLLDSVGTVLSIEPDLGVLDGLEVGLIGISGSAEKQDLQVEVRALGKDFGEDPVTGSLNAGLAVWLGERGVLPRNYTAHQGRKTGADGELRIFHDGQDYWVGGRCHSTIEGRVDLGVTF